MKRERPQRNRAESLDERFARDPVLHARLHQLADLRDELLAQGCSLDEVERKVIEEMRRLGNEFLSMVAQVKADEAAHRDSKKTELADHLWRGRDRRAGATVGPAWATPSTLRSILRAGGKRLLARLDRFWR